MAISFQNASARVRAGLKLQQRPATRARHGGALLVRVREESAQRMKSPKLGVRASAAPKLITGSKAGCRPALSCSIQAGRKRALQTGRTQKKRQQAHSYFRLPRSWLARGWLLFRARLGLSGQPRPPPPPGWAPPAAAAPPSRRAAAAWTAGAEEMAPAPPAPLPPLAGCRGRPGGCARWRRRSSSYPPPCCGGHPRG